MKEKNCCITGHRDIPITDFEKTINQLEIEIIRLVKKGVYFFNCGGALGFDTLAAITLLRLMDRYPVKLNLILPCKDQSKSWDSTNKMIYNEIMSAADSVEFLADHYYPGCMQTRNRELVDRSKYCLCYMTKSTGGTFYTVNYATQHRLEIINVANDK